MHVTGDTISGGTRILQQSALFQSVDSTIKDCVGSSPTFMSECSCQHVASDPVTVQMDGQIGKTLGNKAF
eukprot:1088820-Amphidinium_carterae.1